MWLKVARFLAEKSKYIKKVEVASLRGEIGFGHMKKLLSALNMRNHNHPWRLTDMRLSLREIEASFPLNEWLKANRQSLRKLFIRSEIEDALTYFPREGLGHLSCLSHLEIEKLRMDYPNSRFLERSARLQYLKIEISDPGGEEAVAYCLRACRNSLENATFTTYTLQVNIS